MSERHAPNRLKLLQMTHQMCQFFARHDTRPEIVTQVPDLSNYGEVYLGYPIWWGMAPRPVMTFVERCRWEGKTVHLFCTHEGSGITQSAAELKKALTGAQVDVGPMLAGHDINKRIEVVNRFLQGKSK